MTSQNEAERKYKIIDNYGHELNVIPTEILEKMTMKDIKYSIIIKQNRLIGERGYSDMSMQEQEIWDLLNVADEAMSILVKREEIAKADKAIKNMTLRDLGIIDSEK